MIAYDKSGSQSRSQIYEDTMQQKVYIKFIGTRYSNPVYYMDKQIWKIRNKTLFII